jgi:3-oxoacyl-[acyl-carrier protein] reductase/meso-butanediol dehydrogenase/(S,S)-butanediol dehydrogenase/diacetyl reductase
MAKEADMGYTLSGFDGKVAVVTGAGRMRSIGRPIALALARAGCDLVLTGSGKPPSAYPEDERGAGWRDIESVADEVRALGRRALPVVSDVRDAQAVEALADRVVAEFGRVDFVVNNAGSTRGSDRVPALDLPLSEWQRVLGTNLDGTFYMARCFARHMVEAGRGGAIVNISSIAGRNLMPHTAAYATSKAAIDALGTVLAGELGASGIRVNAVAPGMIDTSRMDDLPRGEVWDRIVRSNIPLRRAGTGEDIAHMVVFLCSDQASWITGQTFYVDGGHGHAPRN